MRVVLNDAMRHCDTVNGVRGVTGGHRKDHVIVGICSNAAGSKSLEMALDLSLGWVGRLLCLLNNI